MLGLASLINALPLSKFEPRHHGLLAWSGGLGLALANKEEQVTYAVFFCLHLSVEFERVRFRGELCGAAPTLQAPTGGGALAARGHYRDLQSPHEP